MSIKESALKLLRKNLKEIRFIAIFTCVLALAGGAYLFWENPKYRDTLLTITPIAPAERGVDADEIEELNSDKFMITYTCPEGTAVKAVNSGYSAVLLATNYSFPYVMEHNMLNGGFFTNIHQEHKTRAAVLNGKAAFDLFGSVEIAGNELMIDGVKYKAVGVIDDSAESLNIYIPITLTDSRPNEFSVRLGGSVSEALVKNELKQFNITDNNYEFTRKTVFDRLINAISFFRE